MARLVGIAGPVEGKTFDIDKGATFGREAHNTFPLQGVRGCSRDHAKVWQVGLRQFSIADVGSTNGTLVNNERVSRASLKDGDTIQIGEASFRFELGEAEKPKPKTVDAAEKARREQAAAALRGDAGRSADSSASRAEPSLEVKQRILQYNKKGKSGSQLGWDVSQTAGPVRYIMMAVAVALCVALFFLMKNLTTGDATPTPTGAEDTIDGE